MHHTLRCRLSNLGGDYSLNFAQHLRSAPTRRCSGRIRLPEEPVMPGRSPSSVKFFCLFGLTGKKFTLRSIRKFPGFSVAPQLFLREAASSPAVQRTSKDRRQINSVLAAFALMQRCHSAEVGENRTPQLPVSSYQPRPPCSTAVPPVQVV